jgi:hypothetical protein
MTVIGEFYIRSRVARRRDSSSKNRSSTYAATA